VPAFGRGDVVRLNGGKEEKAKLDVIRTGGKVSAGRHELKNGSVHPPSRKMRGEGGKQCHRIDLSTAEKKGERELSQFVREKKGKCCPTKGDCSHKPEKTSDFYIYSIACSLRPSEGKKPERRKVDGYRRGVNQQEKGSGPTEGQEGGNRGLREGFEQKKSENGTSPRPVEEFGNLRSTKKKILVSRFQGKRGSRRGKEEKFEGGHKPTYK